MISDIQEEGVKNYKLKNRTLIITRFTQDIVEVELPKDLDLETINEDFVNKVNKKILDSE